MFISKKISVACLVLGGLVFAGCDNHVVGNATVSQGSENSEGTNSKTVVVNTPEYKDVEDLLTFDEKKITFIAKDGFVDYQWFIDGKLSTENTTGFYCLKSGTLDMNITANPLKIMVVVTDINGNMYSASMEYEGK